MPTDKRQRKRQGRQARLEAERAAALAAARRRRLITTVVAVVGVFAVLLLISQTGGDDGDDEVATDEAPVAVEPALYGDTPCAPEDKPDEPVLAFDSQFEDCLEEGTDYQAELTTADGTFTIDLLEAQAPAAVNNFVNLARSGFYDGTIFHRVIEDFVAQGGDPTGARPGTGDPGYALVDELPEGGEYELGSVAMANSGPNSSGGQFFVVTGQGGIDLDPDYSLFGSVTDGMDVVMAIELGVPPEEPTVLESVEIVEG